MSDRLHYIQPRRPPSGIESSQKCRQQGGHKAGDDGLAREHVTPLIARDSVAHVYEISHLQHLLAPIQPVQVGLYVKDTSLN
jgi:hypothetical protein